MPRKKKERPLTDEELAKILSTLPWEEPRIPVPPIRLNPAMIRASPPKWETPEWTQEEKDNLAKALFPEKKP